MTVLNVVQHDVILKYIGILLTKTIIFELKNCLHLRVQQNCSLDAVSIHLGQRHQNCIQTAIFQLIGSSKADRKSPNTLEPTVKLMTLLFVPYSGKK